MMCSLCGMFGPEEHWSTGPVLAATADAHKRRLERHNRIKTVNAFLSRANITMRDWQGESYILEGATGHFVIVDNIMEVWQALDKEFNKTFDPLSLAEMNNFNKHTDEG